MNIAKLKLSPLGNLTPDPALLAEIARQGTDLNDFCGSSDIPQPFVDFLALHGLQPRERQAMLFAHNAGVNLHTDEHPIACWFLCGLNQRYCGDNAFELIVGGKSMSLRDSQVIYFDARQRHGVISGVTSLWGCLSVYVKPLRKSVAPSSGLN